MRWLSLLFLPYTVGHIIKGISIYGLETEQRNFVCGWKNDLEFYIQKLQHLGFNALRFPFCHQYIHEGNFDRLDHGLSLAQKYNMSVILDFHRVSNTHQEYSPLSVLSLEDFIQTWEIVVDRYIAYDVFHGINSWNEYQGNDGCSNPVAYSTALFNRIEEMYPARLHYYMTGYFWASDLRGCSLEHLPYSDRIGYSVHKYVWSGTADRTDWDNTFGSVEGIPIEKIVIGEFGWFGDKPNEVDWATRFIAYLREKGIQHSCYWTIALSHDTGNLYHDDCDVIQWNNFELLKTLWEDQRFLRTENKCKHIGWNGCVVV